jgi:hypothetical protein
VHAPFEHTAPCATSHAVPHPPQFFGSLFTSVQTPLHKMPLSKHEHAPD